MRIMQIVSGHGVNGAVLQCLALTRSLAERGHEITFVCRPDSWTSQQPPGPGVRHVFCHQRRWPLDDLREIRDVVRERDIQIIHTHQSRAHVFGIMLRWLTKVPCVATAHARHLQPHWRFNSFVIANSQATFRYQRRWNLVPGSRMEVVPYLLDWQRFAHADPQWRRQLRDEWGVPPHAVLAGIVGDLIPRKGQLLAVQAWSRIVREHPEARLVFVGADKQPEYVQAIRAEVERAGLADQIIWAGYRTDIPAVMQALDICVSAAVEEAFGLTIPEAMAARRPVVAAKVGGVPESVLHEQTGLLVRPRDPDALATALLRMIADQNLRERCGERGQELVRRVFDQPTQLSHVESIYERLVPRVPIRCAA